MSETKLTEKLKEAQQDLSEAQKINRNRRGKRYGAKKLRKNGPRSRSRSRTPGRGTKVFTAA